MTTPPDVLGLGCSAVDDLIAIPHYPHADSKMQVLWRERQCGGLTATALVAAAKLGVRAAYAGSLGACELSDYVIRQLQAAGVDTRWVHRGESARPIHSTILLDQQTGGRNIFYDLSGIAPLPEDWPDESVIRGARVLCVDHFSIAAQIRAARIGREAGISIVADFERSNVSGFDRLLSLVDHLILPRDFALLLTGSPTPHDAIEAIWNESRRLVALTCGADGCHFMCRDHRTSDPARGVRHQPSFCVDVVDTTGCGDVFHGAYAAALVRELPLPEAIRFATAAAALKATRHGGQAGAPTLAEVETFVNDR